MSCQKEFAVSRKRFRVYLKSKDVFGFCYIPLTKRLELGQAVYRLRKLKRVYGGRLEVVGYGRDRFANVGYK